MSIVAITGGAGALGSALARLLVARGHGVALYDTDHGRERGALLARELGADRAFAYAGDFARGETWEAALAATKAALGELPSGAALVAGAWAGGTPLHEAKDDATYEKMISANLETAYRALRALLPPMVAAGRGSIVVIGSRAVERPWTSAGAAEYAATKSAVVAMARTAAAEVVAHGVRVNAILPSTMDTPANRASMPRADASTWVSLESAAGVIAFLLSDDARDVSGAILPVYGRA